MLLTDEQSQREAREYVLNRPLTRPKTTVWAPILLLFGTIAFGVFVGFSVAKIIEVYCAPNTPRNVVIVLGSVVLSLFCAMWWVFILCVKCYQHYASEYIRRSCLCKPTCSEYAILVLKKYSLIKAVVLIYIRLKKTCTGNTYKIDFPKCCQKSRCNCSSSAEK